MDLALQQRKLRALRSFLQPVHVDIILAELTDQVHDLPKKAGCIDFAPVDHQLPGRFLYRLANEDRLADIVNDDRFFHAEFFYDTISQKLEGQHIQVEQAMPFSQTDKLPLGLQGVLLRNKKVVALIRMLCRLFCQPLMDIS